MAIKAETFIQGKTVEQEQDDSPATLLVGTGVVTYKPASFNSFTEAAPATTEVGKRRTCEPFILAFWIPPTVAKGTTSLWTAKFKCRLMDVVILPTSAETGGTIKLVNDSTDITNAMTCAVDKTIARAGTIDDAQHELAVDGVLKCTTAATGANQCGCWIYVTLARVV